MNGILPWLEAITSAPLQPGCMAAAAAEAAAAAAAAPRQLAPAPLAAATAAAARGSGAAHGTLGMALGLLRGSPPVSIIALRARAAARGVLKVMVL